MKRCLWLVPFLLSSTMCYAQIADKGVDYFDKVIEANPQNAEAYRRRGLAYEKEHDTSQAMLDYDKAIQLNPNVALLYWNRGLLFYKNGNCDQAIADFSKYLQFKPKSELTLLMRGQAYYQNENYDLAISDFNNYLNIDRQWKWSPYFAYIDLAFTYLKSRNNDKAWEYARKAQAEELISHPNTSDSVVGLGSYREVIEELENFSVREK